MTHRSNCDTRKVKAMYKEETINTELTKNFPFLADKIRVQRERRIFADVPFEKFREIMDFSSSKLEFKQLCTITGLDDGDNLSFLYHFSRADGIMLNIKYSVPKSNPILKTVTDIYPSAHIYERELEDLLGAKVEGLPEGKRYPLPDDWPKGQYPLRKDWTIDQLKKGGS